MNVADYILARLADIGVTHIPMLYGGAIGELSDALTRQDRIKHVVFQSEQGAVFAAEAMAKVTGIPGVVMVTSGPGGGNIITGLQNCYYDSVPLIAVCGQVSTKFECPDPDMRQLGFQESPLAEIAKPITKLSIKVMRAEDISLIMVHAIHYATHGRPGPVLIELPTDIAKTEINAEELTYSLIQSQYAWSPPELPSFVSAYLADLYQAKRPLLLIGGGARHYKSEFRAMAERMGIPVVCTWNALDVVSSDLPYYAGRIGTYGGAGRNFAVQNCDLLLSIGCRMSGRITGGMPETFAQNAKHYCVNIDKAPLPINPDATLHCDAGVFMRALASRDSYQHARDWFDQCIRWKDRYDPVRPEHVKEWHHYGFMRLLSRKVSENAIICADTGGNVIMMGHCWEFKQGQTYVTSNGNTPMGFSLCAAIGAWFADPTRPIICIIGDGGLQLNIQELQTIKHYNIPVKIFVINNHILGNTKIYQMQNYGGRCIACDEEGGYSAPEFTAIAFAYGIQAYLLNDWSRFDRIAAIVLASKEPMLVDVVHHDFCDYLPKMVKWTDSIEKMEPYLPQDEYEANMKWSKQ